MKELAHFSLFSGIGGLDLAAEWAGFKTVGQCEWGDYQTKVLEKHWPDVPRWRDIHDLSADDFVRRTGQTEITVLSGGFPCQPHSTSGKRLASADERDLWPEYRRCVSEFKPRWVVGENVRGILSSEGGRFFGNILRDLSELGYRIGWYMFPAMYAGSVFQGERVAIIATTVSVRGGGMEEDAPYRPDDKYLEMLETWKTGSNVVLRSFRRPESLPDHRSMRNDDGFSETVDRFTCVGNSVIPFQFYPIFKTIAEIEKRIN